MNKNSYQIPPLTLLLREVKLVSYQHLDKIKIKKTFTIKRVTIFL